MRRFGPLRSSLSLSLLLLFSSTANLSSQPQQPPPAAQETPLEPVYFDESIDVRVVNVEAVVTGKDGKRVSGLTAKDFRLLVDGKPVPIEYFTEVEEGEAKSTGPAPEGAAAGDAPQSVATGAVRTNYLVFVDDYFGVEKRRNEVLESLKKDVDRLGENDRMAIVSFDGARLSMLSSWSGSNAGLKRAFDQAMRRPARGLDRITELRSFYSDQSLSSQAVGDDTPLDLNARSPGLTLSQSEMADRMVRQIESEVSAVVAALRAFAMPEGRKVMLLLSGGWPMSVQSFLTDGQGIPSKMIADGEEVFRPLTNTANLLGYTIYPIDLPGVEASGASDASSMVSTAGGGLSREQEIEGSLYFVAKETGGRAILNSNRTIAFTSAAADTRSYYWVGFSPSWQRNDKRHTVKMEMVTKGLDVRARNSFLDLSKKAEVSMMVESAINFGGLPGTSPLPFKVGTPVKRGLKGTEIPITLGIPSEIMTVLPVGKKFVAKLELRVAASDERGNASEVPVVPLDLSSDHAPQPGKFVKYETKIILNGKAQELVVAVYDPISGKLASGRGKVPPIGGDKKADAKKKP